MSAKMGVPRRFIGPGVLVVALLAAAAAWYVFDPGFRVASETSRAAADLPQRDFEPRVRAYILDHPEVILDSMERFQARRQAAETGEAQVALKARADEVFRDPASPVGGNVNGDVTLVEFFDYNCPYCRRMAPVMAETERTDPRLRIVYKEFPILGPGSIDAAKAALAAQRQGRYVAFHKALIGTKGAADQAAALAAAAAVGLDVERLKADMNDPAIQAALDRNVALAHALRINGTLGFVVGDQILRGATDLATLQELVRKARAAR